MALLYEALYTMPIAPLSLRRSHLEKVNYLTCDMASLSAQRKHSR
jgi:hypothetical protein